MGSDLMLSRKVTTESVVPLKAGDGVGHRATAGPGPGPGPGSWAETGPGPEAGAGSRAEAEVRAGP